ncbi:MAG: lytic transglycosylase domain-containing protein [Treponema sp.]|jgi:soluble lytic murein transglycosylase-like protein|nr:lytic transglycosylase domain-containing protein [Treponema sp.]
MKYKVVLSAAISFFAAWNLNYHGQTLRQTEAETETETAFEAEASAPARALPADPARYHEIALGSAKSSSGILEAYRNPKYDEAVRGFFTALTGSRELALILLEGADKYNLDPALVFALCWEESRYNRYARNAKNVNGSVDRGLFQLNDRSFPRLSEGEFFNPAINTAVALKHLRFCIDTGGSDVSGLAMYNAGPARVGKGATPPKTLNYIARINNYRSGITGLFRQELLFPAGEGGAVF